MTASRFSFSSPWLATALGTVALVVLGQGLSSYGAGLVIDCLVFAILALGLNLLLGYAGLPSLGHAAYFGVGAYTAGLVYLHVSTNFWLAAAAAIVASMAVAAVYALLALRTTGVYFLIITLALGQITWATAFSWRSVTGGDDGLRGIGRPDLGLPGLSVADTDGYYLLVVLATAAALCLMAILARSPFGHALRGIQQNGPRMAALGYNVWLYKYLAFIISAGFAGYAGVLFVFYKGFVSPESVGIVISAEITLMVIIGGAGTLAGPVLGAFIVMLLSHLVSGFTDRWITWLGLLYVAAVLFAPRGIVALAHDLVRTRRAS
ncbi:branched-chain amino acid ABC transporter permease [Pigmentiphaga sp. H8]|uniref:branched-chain amino acid ABC transporter permease n=1 Tax=Pigmentiphaga sp. H8 TaxID=2488560 RepID=UPI0013758096|nr:branched-chain amino acid ABC transporter permease [Pigmentiphaga sp. H8]